jgi:hypothetical protein
MNSVKPLRMNRGCRQCLGSGCVHCRDLPEARPYLRKSKSELDVLSYLKREVGPAMTTAVALSTLLK